MSEAFNEETARFRLRSALVKLVEILDSITDELEQRDHPAIDCMMAHLQTLSSLPKNFGMLAQFYADESTRGAAIEGLDHMGVIYDALSRQIRKTVELERAK